MRRPALLLFAALACALLLAQSGRDATEGEDAIPLERALRAGHLSVPSPQHGPWSRGPDGRYWLAQDYLAPLLAVPAVALADALPPPALGRRSGALPRDGRSAERGANDDAWARAFEALLGAFAGAAIGALLFLFAVRRLACPPRAALLGGALAVLATMLLPYARTNYDGVLSGLLLLAALDFALGEGRRDAFSCGLLLGLAVLARFSSAAPAAVVGLAALRRRDLFARAGLAALGALPLLPVTLVLDALRTGHALLPPSALPEYAHNNALVGPFWFGFFGNLVSPGKGLLFYAPLALLAPAGLWLSGRRRTFWAAVGALLALAVLHAKVRNWSGHWAWGPRYLLPAVPLCLAGLGPLLARPRWRLAAMAVAVPSAVVSLAAVFADWQVRIGDSGTGVQELAFDLRQSAWLDHLRALGGALAGRCPRLTSMPAPPCTADLWWVTWPRAGAGAWPYLVAAALAAIGAACAALAVRRCGQESA